ncbi:expressed unknown protein (Partial), partial [Seminavis robusta]|eukprot:Sro2305_g322680.1 n/a (549) ;mRNA; f:14254-16001
MCSPTNKGALKQAGKEDDAEESSKTINGNNRAAAVSSSGHQRSGVSSSRRHHHNNHNHHKFNRSDTAVHLMSAMIQLHVAVEKLQQASPEDCWDQAFLHLVTQTNQASSRGNNSIPKSALREILKNPRVKPVVQMIKYLEDLSGGDDGTIRKSSLDMLLTAAIPTVAGTVDGMVTQKRALSRVARASHNLQQYLPDHVRGDIQFQSSAASDEAATWTEFCDTLEEEHLSIYNNNSKKEEQTPVKRPAKHGTVASLGEENVAPNKNTKHQTTTTVKPAPSQTEGTKPTVPEASKEERSQPTATTSTSGNRNETESKGNQNKNTADDVTTPVRKKATKLPPESQPMPQPVQTPQPFKKTAKKSPIPEDVPTTPGSSKHRRTSSRFPIPPCNNNQFTTGTSQAFTATVTSPVNGSSHNQKATKSDDKETSPMSSWGFALPPGYEKNATSPRYSPTSEPTPTKRRKERAKPTHQFAASRNPPPKLKQPETQHPSGLFSTTAEAKKHSHNPFLSAATFQQSRHSSGIFGAPSEARKENPFFGAPKPTVAQQHAP